MTDAHIAFLALVFAASLALLLLALALCRMSSRVEGSDTPAPEDSDR